MGRGSGSVLKRANERWLVMLGTENGDARSSPSLTCAGGPYRRNSTTSRAGTGCISGFEKGTTSELAEELIVQHCFERARLQSCR